MKQALLELADDARHAIITENWKRAEKLMELMKLLLSANPTPKSKGEETPDAK